MLETFKFEFWKNNLNGELEVSIFPLCKTDMLYYGFSGTYILFPVISDFPNENLLTIFDHYNSVKFSFSPKDYIPEDGTILFGTPYKVINNIDDLLQWNQDICNILDNDC